MGRSKGQRYRFDRDLALVDYVRENWPEHGRRISEMRRGAPLVRFYYPVIGFLTTFVLMGGFTLLVTALARQQVFGVDSEDPRARWMQELLVNSVPVLWVATAVVVAFVVFACVAAGLNKSRELFFQAEKLELDIRKEYYLNRSFCAQAASSAHPPDEAPASFPVSMGAPLSAPAPTSQRPELDFDPRG
jgi:hypothetical protein